MTDIQANQVAKDTIASYDPLVDLLKFIERFLRPLDIYTGINPTHVMGKIVTKIMVELLSTLALVTKDLKQGRSCESAPADLLPY
jgi:hypothetical protein